MAGPFEAGGSLLGGIIGESAAADERGHSRALMDEAIASLQGIKVPTGLSAPVYFRQLQAAGQLTPQQEQAVNILESQAGQVKANPELQSAQMQALTALKGLSNTGMSSADKARLNTIMQQQATQAEGQKQQILQNFAQRGLAGSGNELMSELMASQNAANQANQQGLGVAANAQQNALQALGQYGSQAGSMNQQQFNQDTQAAQAKDELNRFNTQNQLAQQQRNVAGQNNAQQFNLQNQQNIQNQNAGLYNQGLLLQREGEQQQFNDALQKGQALAGQQTKGSSFYGDLGNQIAQGWVNKGKGAGQIVDSMYGGSMMGGGAGPSQLPSEQDYGAIGRGEYNAYAQGGTVEHDCPPGYAEGGQIPMYSGGGSTGGFDGMMEKAVPTIMAALPYLAMLAAGGKVPGKAKVPGDSYANDITMAMVSPGEIIIPRSIVQSEHASELAKKFVECELKKHQGE